MLSMARLLHSTLCELIAMRKQMVHAQRLLAGVLVHALSWEQISLHLLPTRSAASCRRRFVCHQEGQLVRAGVPMTSTGQVLY